jgi:glycosyltransferase involved in cell wall biosynthesis
MKARLPVTVVVPVRNEEGNLEACLDGLGAFAEVVVVDSSSTDRTVEIARKASARVLNFVWQGGFPKKRNWVLTTYAFSTPWVLFLDADERITQPFVREIAARLAEDQYSGFWLRYDNYFLGRLLKHGVPQRKLALFKVGAGLYERIDDRRWSDLDMEVHEHPIIDGPIGEIRAPIDHRDDRGLHRFLERHNAYSTWEANRFLQLKAEPDKEHQLTRRQIAKYRNLERWWFPFAYFVLTYIVHRGFLDGRAGFAHAVFKAHYFMQVWAKIGEAAERLPRATLGKGMAAEEER